MKIIARNSYAKSSYEILDKFEAGLVLLGTEIKSVREGQISLKGSHARITNGELWLTGVHIAPYHQGAPADYDPMRPRKILVSKQELNKIIGKSQEQGLTLIPLSLYIKRNRAKVELALARGLKKWDKRSKIKERQEDRDIQRKLRRKK
ncbi:MAG: SsrA-binding protein SmpB [Patescibacteria group bacterium]|nr:SsrA-binding protein SmpB [Patescibacteria group bacterium]